MQYKDLFIGLLCYNFIFMTSLNCSQEKEKTLKRFFADRITTSLVLGYNELPDYDVSPETLSTFFPIDNQSSIQQICNKDAQRWCTSTTFQPARSKNVNDICLSDQEDLIVCADQYSVKVYDNDLFCVNPCFAAKNYLTCKWYSLPNSNSKQSPIPLLLCSSDQGNVFLRNIDRNINLVKIKHGNTTNAIAMDVNTKKIVTGSDDNNACIWDCKGENDTFLFEPQLLLTLPHGGTVWKAVISNDGTMVATACLDGYARLFNITDGSVLCDIKHNDQVCFVHITKDNKKLISAGDDGNIFIVDIKDGKVSTLYIHGKIHSFCVSGDDKVIVAGTDDGLIKVWSLTDDHKNSLLFEKTIYRNDQQHFSSVNHLSFNENANLLAVASGKDNITKKNGKCCIFDIASGELLLCKDYANPVMYALLNKSGSMLVTAENKGKMTISKKYKKKQTYLRKLFFLWLLIKRIDSTISVEKYLQDIKTNLNLDYSVDNTWYSFHSTEQHAIWSKCVNIMKEREEEMKRVKKLNLAFAEYV